MPKTFSCPPPLAPPLPHRVVPARTAVATLQPPLHSSLDQLGPVTLEMVPLTIQSPAFRHTLHGRPLLPFALSVPPLPCVAAPLPQGKWGYSEPPTHRIE